jgi:hypothetical protein
MQLLHCMSSVVMAHSNGRHFDGRPSLSGHCGRGWTCNLPGPIAIDTRQSQDGTVKNGLHRPQAQRDHFIVTAAGSRPDCRAVLIQIVAL